VVVRDLVLLKGLEISEKKGHFVNFSHVKRKPRQIFIPKLVHIWTDHNMPADCPKKIPLLKKIIQDIFYFLQSKSKSS
jgi:hypothetical protein